MTDARTAEYALRQILRCGIVKAAPSSNTSENISYVSSATPSNSNQGRNSDEIQELSLPDEMIKQIENLGINILPDNDIYSASVAFLAGYIIKKLDDKFHCDVCLSPLLSTTIPGPLMKLILLQDHGGLVYPNAVFVGLVQKIADIVQKVLPFLEQDNTCNQLFNCLRPHLSRNTVFCCPDHKDVVCEIIIKSTVRPVLNNICQETTDRIRKSSVNNKPVSRKILKL